MKHGGVGESDIAFARQQLKSLGLKVTFGRHVLDCNPHLTADPQARLEDLHEALADPEVKGILAVSGGVGAIQLLEGINYGLIASHPKILCGYSDIAYLCNAVYARTGVVTYYGPNFSTFMMRKGFEYTLRSFHACLFDDTPLHLSPAPLWSDDNWIKDQVDRKFLPNEGFWAIREGEAQGTIVGGSAFILNMLQASPYVPPLADSILFLESPSEGKASLMALDSALRALSFLPQFEQVRGVVIGRYSRDADISRDKLVCLMQSIPALARLPVAANVDFGHTSPILTLPVGGRCQLRVQPGKVAITISNAAS